MGALYIESDPHIGGVTRVSVSRALPRPHIGVFGAVHGNETCGLVAIIRLLSEAQRGEFALLSGTLVLVHGNPSATRVHLRHLEGGADLNRLFDYHFVSERPPEAWTSEHHRALELRPLLESLDALIDLHSTSVSTPPFAIASRVPGSEQLALGLGLAYVTSGWDAPGMLGDQVVMGPLTRRERPGVSVECGQHDHPEAPQVAYACAIRMLEINGLLKPRAQVHQAPRRLVIRDALKRPSPSFRFATPISGMQRLEPGTLIGADESIELRVRHECYAVMPNDRCAVGQDLLYLAVPRQP